MSKQADPPPIKRFLAANGISQADLARGTKLTTGYVSLLANEVTGASQDTINAILAFLSERLGRRVTYEELFGAPAAVVLVARVVGE